MQDTQGKAGNKMGKLGELNNTGRKEVTQVQKVFMQREGFRRMNNRKGRRKNKWRMQKRSEEKR